VTDTARAEIPAGETVLHAELSLPGEARGLVLLAGADNEDNAGLGNRQVADRLNANGLATLSLDLLTSTEEHIDNRSGELRFDIGLMSERVVAGIDWLASHGTTSALPLGLFGAHIGAAAALAATAARPDQVAALVCRDLWPEPSETPFTALRCPLLLLVGAGDDGLLELNRAAAATLETPWDLALMPATTGELDEPTAVDAVSARAADWFAKHFVRGD
jgi:dienelactone hydrolase